MVSENERSSDEWERPPSQAIIEAIADAEGVDLSEVGPPAYEPLYSVVDPEALDSLFRASGERGPTDLRVDFTYEGYEVTVRSGGRVDVAALPTTDLPESLVEERGDS